MPLLRRERYAAYAQALVCALTVLAVLWRGGKTLEMTWLMGGVAVLVTFLQYGNSRSDRREVPRVLWLLLLFFLLGTFLSQVFSQTLNYGLDEIVRDTAGVLLLLWVARAPDDERGAFTRRFLACIVAATVIACALGLLVYVLQPVSRSVGSFFDWRYHTDYWPNAWAEFLLMTWPLLAVWLTRRHFLVRILLLSFPVTLLLLSYSRGAILVFAAQLLLLGTLVLLRTLRSGDSFAAAVRSFLVHAALVLTISVILFTLMNAARGQFHDVESVSRKVTLSASEGTSSVTERRDFWKDALTLSMARPLLGWGPYSFRFIQPRLQRAVFATSDHPHNVVLKIAVERGWITALLYMGILAVILLLHVRKEILLQEQSPLSPRERGLGGEGGEGWRTAAFIAVIGVLLHNLIDYNLQFVGIALPLWILLGFLSPTIPASKSASVRIIDLTLTIIFAVILILEGRMLAISSIGRHAEAWKEYASALPWYDRSRWEIYSRDLHLSRASVALQLGKIDAAERALDDYERLNRHDARLWILRGNIAELRGEIENALRSYATAMRLAPLNHLEPLEGMLRLILELPIRDRLRWTDRQVMDTVFRKFADAILINSHYIALSQNVETFERVSLLLQQLFPESAEYYQLITEHAVENAGRERERLAGRHGLLW